MTTTPEWPCTLPCGVLRDQWGQRPVSPNIRTEMDDGEIAVTRKLANIRYIHLVAWELTALQFEIFRHFWACDLCGGGSWFMAPVFEGARTVEHRVRFASDPPFDVSSPANGRFRVVAELEMAEIPLMSRAERISTHTELSGQNTTEFTDRLALLARFVSGRTQ